MTASSTPIPSAPGKALPRLRPATTADTTLLADIHARSRAATYRGMLPDAVIEHVIPATSLSLWQEKMTALVAGAGHALVAELDGRPVAFVVVMAPEADGRAYLDSLHALPDRKGGGAGSALLDAATHWARARGARRLHLRVIEGNTGAIGFYESRGWRRTGQMDDEMNGVPVVSLLYELALT